MMMISLKYIGHSLNLIIKRMYQQQRVAEILENNKRPDERLSDDDRDFLEDFMEFLNQKKH